MSKKRSAHYRPPNETGDIRQATTSYERWMHDCTTVVQSDLRLKHEQMKQDAFSFLRGTYYRWAQLWPTLGSDLRAAPTVLSVGDLHVNSFGTWRDAEGRLCWGVDDFDESYPLPYTNDLVRLAASMKIVRDAGDLSISLWDGCDAILDGYLASLKAEGKPFVLEEHDEQLGRLGVDSFKPPRDFWGKLNRLPAVQVPIAKDVKRALEKTLPDPTMEYKVVRRRAGMGSLGQHRFVAIATFQGGFIAREAKAVVPSANAWLEAQEGGGQSYYEQAISDSVRSHDPYQEIEGSWLIRRLSPDSNPIDIQDLPKRPDEYMLLHSMGAEAANVHLGTRRQVHRILKDIRGRKGNWLRAAAKEMARAVEKEWKEYRKA